MPILYLMNATPFLEESMLQAALPLVDIRRRERIMQIKSNKNRALSLAAGVLLSYAVNTWKERMKDSFVQTDAEQVMNYLTEENKQTAVIIPETKAGAHGKPYLKNVQDVFFNLSHSGEYVVCVMSDCEIGVDIQQYRKNIKEGLLNKVLHESEKNLHQACTKEEKEACFYRIWAAKEAYAKYTGEGLSVDFRLLLTDFKEGIILDTRTGIKNNLYITEQLPDYAIAVVSERQ